MAAFLGRGPALLLLDNFEHLVKGGAEFVLHLLEQVEHLTLLVTSRQRLDLEGEREFSVGPLPVPGAVASGQWLVARSGPADPAPLTTDHWPLTTVPSVALFVDRAQAVRADFQITARNAAAVAALCRRLEGLPLAIELAAARAWALTPQQMLARLERRFDLLVGRQRTADPRHSSLRATLDWSYQLLSPELQRFFARLSVFRGGWTAAAAEAVCGEPRALPYLEQLGECSMVQATETAEGTGERCEVVMRFHLLETLREYGAERLAEEDRASLARRHALFYLALAETAEPELQRADQELWLDRLEVEHDNLRAALAWSLKAVESGHVAQPGAAVVSADEDGTVVDPAAVGLTTHHCPPTTAIELGLRLGGALVEFWSARGYRKEGHDRLARLLSQPGAASGTAVHAKALAGAGRFSGLEAARALCEQALAIWRRLGDRAGIADTLQHLGSLHYPGDLPAARAAQEESLAIRRELGDQRAIALSLRCTGWVALAQGQVATARACLEESTAIFRGLDDRRGLIGSLDSLGYMAYRHGDADTARSLFEEELAAATELDDKEHITYARTHLAEVACLYEDYATALPLLEQARAIWQEIDDPAGLINTLLVLGWAVRCQGDHATAHELATEALSVSRKWDSNRSIAWSTWLLGEVAGDLGDWEGAAAHFSECLTLFGEGQQSDALVIPRCLQGLARLACVRGKPARAARLLGTAEALDAASGVGLWPAQRREFEQSVSAARAQLGDAEFAAAWTKGQAMPVDQALALALQEVSDG